MSFKGAEMFAKVAARPSEAAEFYLYFFMVAYLIVFERRIRELAAETASATTNAKAKTKMAKTKKA